MRIVDVRHPDCSLKETAGLAGTQEEDNVTFPNTCDYRNYFTREMMSKTDCIGTSSPYSRIPWFDRRG